MPVRIGSNPHAERTYRNFAQLDLVLVPRTWARAVVDVKSCMGEALATHHFLVEAAVSLQVEAYRSTSLRARIRQRVSTGLR